MHHTPLEALHVHVALDDLWLKLRHVELRRDGRMEQQLIESHVLIIARNGEGRLNIGLHEYRLRQDAVHIALPGQTIGVSSEETGGLDLYVIRFDVCRDSGLAGKGDTFPLKGSFQYIRRLRWQFCVSRCTSAALVNKHWNGFGRSPHFRNCCIG
ncbi:hypothetical protein P7H16_10170 [Paenibacillus larvae]|nr:hypothetical protein [Paenibacillus larvae]MDT2236541.1 hypothetical protein [Paenibacillus larvae]MDT2240593.1 hypothetical protein [Paenibacillus larvae]MDT2247227.1 hypothetical protein [Paenibacillus larvae]MDT2258388.1 hypothetical protein [Paenibacillus larvae]MDT2273885.1 hypothetical protein [Paenibacillus larvae]